MTEIINTFVFPIIRRDWILDALKSLRANTPENFRVIVIDQTQPDAQFGSALRHWCDLWVKASKNYGFAQAANLGIRLAPTPYITVCNDDVEFFWDGWWQGIEETYARYDNLAAVNPMSPKEPGWGWGVKGYVYYCANCGARYIDEERPCKCDNYEPLGYVGAFQYHTAQKARLMIDAANGAMIDGIACWCPVFRREALDEIGLFDERFNPGGGEDYDWSARCYQAGYRGIATSLSWVWHHWGQSKDAPDGFDTALPLARPRWNYLSTKGNPKEGLWHEDVDCWGHGCVRTDENVYRAPL